MVRFGNTPSSLDELNIILLQIWLVHLIHTNEKNYPYLLADELPEFLSSVDKYQGSQIVRTALNILMLTGLRPGELRKSEWSFIDFESRTWKLPEKS